MDEIHGKSKFGGGRDLRVCGAKGGKKWNHRKKGVLLLRRKYRPNGAGEKVEECW